MSLQAASALIGLLAGGVALCLSGLNLYHYFSDREAKADQEVFQNQVGLSRLYFEKIAINYCASKAEAYLLVQVIEHSAKTAGGADRSGVVTGLAKLMRADFDKRSCPTDARVSEATAETGGVATVTEAAANTTYALKEQAAQSLALSPASTGASGGTVYTVYVQYKSEAAGARARDVRAAIDRDGRFKAPAIDQVDQVPSRDEIRIYKDTPEDRRMAEALKSEHLKEARIVSLARAYPKLPAGTLEVWLRE
jgi:hypothetical protein